MYSTNDWQIIPFSKFTDFSKVIKRVEVSSEHRILCIEIISIN